MLYETISVKEAVEKINADRNGWFLPAVQRPYVWGSRYESEKYICKLFDSILKGYPIGTLIVWNTENEIPYRPFIENYRDGETSQQVDKHLFSRQDKGLVYDGQQRLQTLFSCLKYTLNNRVLVYDLLYNENNAEEDDEYGFSFFDKNADLPTYIILMSELFIMPEDGKTAYRKKIINSIQNITDEQEALIEKRLDNLWSIFVAKDKKSLACFQIDSHCKEDEVNDIFQRLNTGGVPLSGADLLFSKIKEKYPKFEEDVSNISVQIKEATAGYYFSPNEILQLINLIVKGRTRIDPAKTKSEELDKFQTVQQSLLVPLKEFFIYFIKNSFNINNSSIISRKLALLPLIVYAYKNHIQGRSFVKISDKNIISMKQYLILSQVCDWNTQGIVENACKEFESCSDFPLDSIKKIAQSKNRYIVPTISMLENNTWFVLKILLPNRQYINSEMNLGRYRPELDHIFPKKLKNRPEDYFVDIIWNLQPVTGQTNGIKSDTHPFEFFSAPETKVHIIEYDFLPELTEPDWKNSDLFIANRKKKMVTSLRQTYSLEIQE